MKKLFVVLLVSAFILAACGCTPYLNVQVSREPQPTAEPSAEISEEPSEEPSAEPSVLPDDIAVPTEDYELADITFECGEELEYYKEKDGTEGYTLEVVREIMLDVQAISLENDVEPVFTEKEIDIICKDAVNSYIDTAEENAELKSEPIVETMTIDGTDGYYTVFEAEIDGQPVTAGNVTFATKDYVYLISVICGSEEAENLYFDLIDSIKIINPADYSAQPSSSRRPSSGSGSVEEAVETAKDYIKYSAFSRDGLIDQLVYEGFSQSEAEEAVDSLDVDWSEQCAKAAQDYVDLGGISESGLIDVLEYSGFDSKDVKAAVGALDVDWREQAVKCAEDYIEYTQMTDEAELIDQLEFEGFSKSDATYGAQTALAEAGY